MKNISDCSRDSNSLRFRIDFLIIHDLDPPYFYCMHILFFNYLSWLELEETLILLEKSNPN